MLTAALDNMNPLYFTGLLLVWCACSGVLSSNRTSEEERFLIEGPTSKRRWHIAKIPYEIDNSVFNAKDKALILSAMEEFHRKTACISFVPKTREYSYIRIARGSGCLSWIGRMSGKQSISLDPGCMYKGTIVHELMHAIGFFHEQARTDRNRYIRVNEKNVIPGAIDQFKITDEKWKATDLGYPYDLDSIMHYSGTEFTAKNGKKTIETIRARDQYRIDDRKDGLSMTDVKRLDKLCSLETKCEDSDKKWCDSWKNIKKYCHRNDVRKYCKASCNICTEKKPTTRITRAPASTTRTPATTTAKPNCFDEDPFYCKMIKKANLVEYYCEKPNPDKERTRRLCKKTCQICTTRKQTTIKSKAKGCFDEEPSLCNTLTKNLQYYCRTPNQDIYVVRSRCKKSCQICTTGTPTNKVTSSANCFDKSPKWCDNLSARYLELYCESPKDGKTVRSHCKKSCKYCL